MIYNLCADWNKSLKPYQCNSFWKMEKPLAYCIYLPCVHALRVVIFEITIWRDADEEDDQRAKVQMTSVWKSRNWQASPQIQGQKFKVITFKKKKCYLKYLETGENYGLESWKINLPPSPSLMIFCSKLTVVNELRHTQFLIIHQTFYTDFIFNHNSNSVNWVALISFLENILF